MTMRHAVLVALTLLLAATPALAQVRYKDAEGTTHWVDTMNEVPAEYRASAVGKPAPSSGPSLPGSPSSVSDWERRNRERQWADSVMRCTAQAKLTDQLFDAFVQAPGRVRMIGSTQARFAFSKCLSASGHVLE